MILNVAEAAVYARCHPETVREALRAGELRGMQRAKGGPWKIRSEWVDKWLEAPHKKEVAANQSIAMDGVPNA